MPTQHQRYRQNDILDQLEKVVSDFMAKYPSHTHRIPSVRPGEHHLIAFVRAMASSMAEKQKQLEKLNEEIKEVALEKERFLATMSHEVRTPMNGIFGMVNLLLETNLDDIQRDYLETVLSSSESLLNILDDILDHSKLNAGAMQLRARSFSLSKLLRDALCVYKATADKKGLHLSATLCDTLPDRFIADDLRLKQIICNLVSNAIKYTDFGSVTVTAQPIQRAGRNQLLIQVTDTGLGISPEAGSKLFLPYRQIETEDDRNYQGTGLGLVISRKLTELMGGKIWFESTPGLGSVFSFCIDVEIDQTPRTNTDAIVSRAPLSSTPGNSATTRHVLLVEDNEANQKVASCTLKQLGCGVTIAANGVQAVELASSDTPFDLILMDLNMPRMGGLEATQAIRGLGNRNAAIPIVAMTGMAFPEDQEKCIAVGMNEVLTKPFDLGQLRELVEQLSDPETADQTHDLDLHHAALSA